MTVRLCLSLNTWPTDLARRRLLRACATPADARFALARPILLTREDHQREVVSACCHRAAAAGVHAGMALAHARALLRGGTAYIEPHDARADARALEQLAHAMLRFVPIAAPQPPDALFLDATGCGRLYASPRALAKRILAAVARLGVHTSIGMAPTWGAAWALARFGGQPIRAADHASLARKLDPLPIAALRVDHGTVDALAVIGVETIAQLRALPRRRLGDRFPADLLLRLDQALGLAIETITPVRPRRALEASRTLDGPTTRVDAVHLLARELINEITKQLHENDRGCRRLELTLHRSDLPPLGLHVAASRPTRDPAHLWALLRPALERANLGFGVEALHARALQLARVAHVQRSAWPMALSDDADSLASIAALVDTLSARLGPERVTMSHTIESHLPECAECHLPATDAALITDTASPTDADRPSCLFARPIAAQPTLLLPDGPIAALRFTHNHAHEHHRVITCIGPERIEPEWWREQDAGASSDTPPVPAGISAPTHSNPRDYFKVQTDTGRWLWLFRQSRHAPSHGARWFIHGEWA
ncbi:MAG: Y-family DNA polymerase [Phycisphaerales bacterium]